MTGERGKGRSGPELVSALAALSNPHRIRLLAELTSGRTHVSELARRLGISRPLLYLHLRKLEEAGLVEGSLELSDDGKALKFYAISRFDIRLTPRVIAEAAATLPPADGTDAGD